MNYDWGLTMSFILVLSTLSIASARAAGSATTTTPIKHLVIIFQENLSFDHYFATYPKAANPPGEPEFTANPHTPSIYLNLK